MNFFFLFWCLDAERHTEETGEDLTPAPVSVNYVEQNSYEPVSIANMSWLIYLSLPRPPNQQLKDKVAVSISYSSPFIHLSILPHLFSNWSCSDLTNPYRFCSGGFYKAAGQTDSGSWWHTEEAGIFLETRNEDHSPEVRSRSSSRT